MRTGPWTPPEWNAPGDPMPRQFRERATNMLFFAALRPDARRSAVYRLAP